MSWNFGTSAEMAGQGASAGYSVGGGWGALAGGVIGGITGGFMGGKAGMPNASPLVGMGENDWSFYKQNILPMQQQAMGRAFGPQAYSQAADAATTSVNAQFANAPGEYARREAGLGVKPTAAQAGAAKKSTALNKGLYMAGAQNAARQSVASQQSGFIGA